MSKPSAWKNRIVGHGEEAPDQLLANPYNGRIHSAHQQRLLTEMLEDVGWVQSIVVNQRTSYLIDGHMRAQIAMRRDQLTVPVMYVDLSEKEERWARAMLDRIGTLRKFPGRA